MELFESEEFKTSLGLSDTYKFRDAGLTVSGLRSKLPAKFLNSIIEEIKYLLEQAEIEPDGEDNTQIYQALVALGAAPSLPVFSEIPALELASDITPPYEVQPLNVGEWYEVVYNCHALNPTLNNMFEIVGNCRARYIGPNPVVMTFVSEYSAALVSGEDFAKHAIWRNRVPVAREKNTVFGGYDKNQVSSRMPLQTGDIISNAVFNTDTSVDLRLVSLIMSAFFEGTITAAEIVGAELFSNPDMVDTSGFTAGDTVLSASGGELTITANDSDSACTADITGLTIGEKYRIEIGAKRGVQGTTQTISALSFGTLYEVVSVETTSFVSHIFDVVATATSGTITLSASITGAAADELVLNKLSVKEYL